VTVLLGVDCATQPNKTGLAMAEVIDGVVHVTRCAVGSKSRLPADIILEWLSGCDDVLLALDSPLGWPVTLGEALVGHRAGDSMGIGSDALFRRTTDVSIYQRLDKLPLEVGASWLARTAVASLALLAEIRQRSERPIPLAWEPRKAETWRIIEVYPAATRIAHGAPAGSGGVVGLEHVLDCSAVAPIVARSEDAGDSCVCALAGADFLAEWAVPPEYMPTAKREGWIWAPGVMTADDEFAAPSNHAARPSGLDVRSVSSAEQFPVPGRGAPGGRGCHACARGLPFSRLRECPECDHVFKGQNWDGIDAHWKAYHTDVMPYHEFWDSLCPEHKRRH